MSNTNFATGLFTALGDDSIDILGLQYWASEAQQNRAQAVVDFQFAAKSDIERLYASELLTVHEQLQSKHDEFDYYSPGEMSAARTITQDKMADESELEWPSFFDRSNDDDLLAALADSSKAPVQHSTHSLNDVHVEPAKLVALPDPTDSSALTLDWA
jgi:predicted negative regulator of RcsB-dependent stress response